MLGCRRVRQGWRCDAASSQQLSIFASRRFVGASARFAPAIAAFALLILSGCGGANQEDVGLITGGGSETVTPAAPAGATSTATPAPTPGQAAAIRFVSAQPDTIGVRGSGLPQQSTLTFQVTDDFGTPVRGVRVSFTFVKFADESINDPPEDLTDADGNARVTLTSGERAVSVQITAVVDAVSPPLTVRSTPVNILGGPPSQLHFSLAHTFHNISGRVLYGLTDQTTAFVGDRFGNPVPPGTAVSFTTNGGAIGNLVTTNSLGQATGILVSQQPIPSNGIVSTLATTHGERPFTDKNVNGICDGQDTALPVSEPYYDSNCNHVRDEDEDFIDLNGDQKFNADQGSGTPSCGDQIILFDSICTTFSGNTVVDLFPFGGSIEAGGTRDYTLTISDADGNPIVGGSTVTIAVSGRARLLGPASFSIVDAQTFGQFVDGVNLFRFSVIDNAPNSQTSETDSLIVTVTSANLPAGGNVSVIVTDIITFLAAAAPTPTPTVPPTATPLPGPPPAHIQIALFVNQASDNGDGTLTSVISALVSDATGATVGNDVPVQFSLVVPTPGDVPAGVSVTSPGLTGRGAPCTPGFAVVPQPGDALSCVKYDRARQGQTVTIQALVQTPSGPLSSVQVISLPDLRTATPTSTPTVTPTNTPTNTPLPAAHIQIALFVNQASDNGDGTLTSVISALVTDATGAAVANGVPIQFSLVVPTPGEVPAGVSVTSPGLTGQAAPCTPGFAVVPQPGDALSCVKFDRARQGETVTVQALVQTPSGALINTQTITLPDLRPGPTSTSTPTLVPTTTPAPPPTATATPPAAQIQLALFVNQASSNGDGTLTSIISALVTDATGAAVGNGVAVQFSLVVPTPGSIPGGVSVTSPGFTGQGALCTPGFAVVPQPGDALSCVKYDQARQGQIVTVRAQVQTPSGPLTSTQVITLPDLRPTPAPTGTPSPSPAPTLRPSSVQFVSATPVAIGVRESGLPEQSVLTFRVTDALGKPVAGIAVSFSLTAVDDETILPLQTVTDADGLARTTLSSGVRASTVRVVAGADSDGNGTPDLFAQSTAVAVFGAPPIQSRFSVAAEKLNVPGRVLFGVQDPISAFVNDRFGNAVPPGTAVSFLSNGASVVNQTGTDANGVAKATLLTEEEIPPTGIVTVVAFTRGEESFHDNNGNGVFEPGIDTITGDNDPEPVIDFRPLPVTLAPVPPNDATCPLPPPSPFCNGLYDVGPLFELFVDADKNGVWNPQGRDGLWDNNILVFDIIPVTFSGHLVTPVVMPSTFSIAPGGRQVFTLEVHDDLRNPLVGGSTITITASAGTITGGSITLPDGESFNQLVDGLNRFTFVLSDAGTDTTRAPMATTILVTVQSQNGNGTFILANGTIPQQPMPMPTPTP